jgi:transmembrane E3 ubiquitin-protein ligase
MLQDTFGPAFFLPERFRASSGWDYHPSLGSLINRDNTDIESRSGGGKEVSETGEETLGDCAICMEGIHVEGMLKRSKKSMDGRGQGDDEKKALLAGEDPPVGSGSARPGMFEGGLRRTRSGLMNSKARKNYSLAPCHHLFHTECLEKWLAIKVSSVPLVLGGWLIRLLVEHLPAVSETFTTFVIMYYQIIIIALRPGQFRTWWYIPDRMSV